MVSLIREVCGTSYDMRVPGLNGLGAFNPNVKDVGVFETFTRGSEERVVRNWQPRGGGGTGTDTVGGTGGSGAVIIRWVT